MTRPDSLMQAISTLEKELAVVRHEQTFITSRAESSNDLTKQQLKSIHLRMDRLEDNHDTAIEKLTQTITALRTDIVTLRWIFICYILVLLGGEIGLGDLLKLTVGAL